nr:toprim domain-containing protein [Neisseria mucosa]
MAQLPENVRFLREADYWTTGEDKPLFIGRFPCMVCAIRDTGGGLQGLHMTYFQTTHDKPYGEDGLHAPHYRKLAIKHPETGEALPAKKMQSRKQGSISGMAVHLFPIPENGRLVIAEGIETALAARELFQARDWGLSATLSANSMAKYRLSDDLKEIVIIADNDTPRPVGFKAAHDLAVRAIKQGIKARIWQSDTLGYDALDELKEAKRSFEAQSDDLKHTIGGKAA